MDDDQQAPDAPEAPPADDQQNPDDLPSWARDAITKANREAAKYRTEAATLRPAADQYRILEEASKSETQRLQEAATAAANEAAQARAETVRYRAAATYGISADHFDLLGSGTEEEISSRAEKLAVLLTAAQKTPPTPPPPGRPREQLRPGATPAGVVNEEDAAYAALFGDK